MQFHTTRQLNRAHWHDYSYTHPTLVAAILYAFCALRRWINRVAQRWQAITRIKRERAAFLAMPDSLLRDIGISRHEIYVVAKERQIRSERPFNGEPCRKGGNGSV